MKTKLGISVGFLGALAYFAALFGGWTPALLIAGYVLLLEENTWLKKLVLNVLALLGIFALANIVIGLLPELISLLDRLFRIFGGSISTPAFFYNAENFLYALLTMFRQVLFIVFGLLALAQRGPSLPLIGKFIDKHTVND